MSETGENIIVGQEAFVARIRQALGRDKPVTHPPTPPAIDKAIVRTIAPPGMSASERFSKQATAMGMKIHPARRENLKREVVRILQETKAQSVGLGVGAWPELLDLGDQLRKKGVRVDGWRDTPDIRGMFDIEAGVTDVLAGIADTGSLVLLTARGQSRGLSLAPRVHVAVLREEDIVMDLADFMPRMKELTNAGSAVVLVTGPSKTADIEGVLVTGVHGPGEVHVVVVGEGNG